MTKLFESIVEVSFSSSSAVTHILVPAGQPGFYLVRLEGGLVGSFQLAMASLLPGAPYLGPDSGFIENHPQVVEIAFMSNGLLPVTIECGEGANSTAEVQVTVWKVS